MNIEGTMGDTIGQMDTIYWPFKYINAWDKTVRKQKLKKKKVLRQPTLPNWVFLKKPPWKSFKKFLPGPRQEKVEIIKTFRVAHRSNLCVE